MPKLNDKPEELLDILLMYLPLTFSFFVALSLHTLIFTPKVELSQPTYYPDTCVGFPKNRPDLEWKVSKVTQDYILFERGISLHRDAVVIMGDC